MLMCAIYLRVLILAIDESILLLFYPINLTIEIDEWKIHITNHIAEAFQMQTEQGKLIRNANSEDNLYNIYRVPFTWQQRQSRDQCNYSL